MGGYSGAEKIYLRIRAESSKTKCEKHLSFKSQIKSLDKPNCENYFVEERHP